jgi:hypothetical protein
MLQKLYHWKLLLDVNPIRHFQCHNCAGLFWIADAIAVGVG